MMEEAWKSLRVHIADRLTSPLGGALVISWLAWNWRVVLVLFSDEKVIRKIGLIDHVIFGGAEPHWVAVVYPVLTAFAYLFVYPWPARLVYWYSQTQQRRTQKLRQRIYDETPLTVEESRKLRVELSRLERELRAENDQLAQEVRNARSEVERINGQLEAAEVSAAEANGALSGAEVAIQTLRKELLATQKANQEKAAASGGYERILGVLFHLGRAAEPKELRELTKMNFQELGVALASAEAEGLVRKMRAGGAALWGLTHKGHTVTEDVFEAHMDSE